MTTPISRRFFTVMAGAAVLGSVCGLSSLLVKRSQVAAGALWFDGRPSAEPIPSETVDLKKAFDIGALDPVALVKVDTKAWYSWALLDRTSGAILGSPNMHEPNRACSMIKAWIAADYLAQVKTPSRARQADIEKMIRDSDSITADSLMDELGRLRSLTRMKEICQTADFTPINSWSTATISAHDTCRLADTIADAKVADPQWTQWLLGLMRTVREGQWGVRVAFPTPARSTIAIKNGWDDTDRIDTYYANCLAVHDKWAMAVLTRYPTQLRNAEDLGAGVAESVARQLLQSSELRPLFG
jgi:Beta-lactamase enzyme family